MLDKLPFEVLQLILEDFAITPEYVHYDNGNDRVSYLDTWYTFAQLCRVSRQMKSVAEPFLYKNYARLDSTWHPLAHYSFRKFLKTVLRRPELLQYIQSLYIAPWNHYSSKKLQYASNRSPTCKARVCEKHFPSELHSLYDTHAKTSILGDAWKKALDAGKEAAEIALLMSLAPNLERIEFCMPLFNLEAGTAPTYFWPNLLVTSAEWDPSIHFHRLDSVMLHKRYSDADRVWPNEAGFEIDPFLLFIGLPKLTTFYDESDDPGLYQKRPETYPINEAESHLTELTLGGTCIHPLELMRILKRCTKLQVFDCDFQQELSFVPNFSWNTIGEALGNSCHTLEHLKLFADVMSQLSTEDSEASEGTCVSIGSLRHFTSLKKLDVLQTTLLGFENMVDDINLVVPALPFEEMLPSSLEDLTIDYCTLTVVPYLEGMLANLKEKFPHLRRIHLSNIDLKEFEMDQYTRDQRKTLIKERKDRVTRLKQGFIEAGVECVD